MFGKKKTYKVELYTSSGVMHVTITTNDPKRFLRKARLDMWRCRGIVFDNCVVNETIHKLSIYDI